MKKRFQEWFQGKKTYIAAGGLALLGLSGWWAGALSDAGLMAILLQAFGLVGLRAAMTRHQGELLATLQTVKKIAPRPPRKVAAVAGQVRPISDQVATIATTIGGEPASNKSE